MRFCQIGSTDISASVIALGTWALGGWMWGGSDDSVAFNTIRTALDAGITTIDTAPIYGFGRSETVSVKRSADCVAIPLLLLRNAACTGRCNLCGQMLENAIVLPTTTEEQNRLKSMSCIVCFVPRLFDRASRIVCVDWERIISI